MKVCCICLTDLLNTYIEDIDLNTIQEGSNKCIKLLCGHIYHAKCIKEAFLIDDRCPLCRGTQHKGINLFLSPYRVLPLFGELVEKQIKKTNLPENWRFSDIFIEIYKNII